jgi:hypothetical protein
MLTDATHAIVTLIFLAIVVALGLLYRWLRGRVELERAEQVLADDEDLNFRTGLNVSFSDAKAPRPDPPAPPVGDRARRR